MPGANQTEPVPAPPQKLPSKSDGLALRSVQLFTLATLAVAQPVYNLVSLEPMVLVSQRARPAEILAIPLVLSVLLPLVLCGVQAIAERFKRRLAVWLHLASVACFATVIALPALKRLLLMPGMVLIALAAALGIIAAAAYARLAFVRALLTYASPCALVLPICFLAREPVRSLLSPVPRAAVSAEASRAAPVVMVVFDEFCGTSLMDESQQVDAARYPNFAALAQDATWYRNATTVSENTMHAIPALLTGRRPRHDLPPTAANYPNNLFTLLKDGCGYGLTVFEPFTSLCPEEEGAAAPANEADRRSALVADLFSVYLQFLRPSDMSPMAPRKRADEIMRRRWESNRSRREGLIRYDRYELRQQQFEHFIECLEPRDGPVLYFLHVLLPHSLYEYLPNGQNHTGIDPRRTAIGADALAAEGAVHSPDSLAVAQVQQLYLLQLCAVDRLIGQMLNRLKQTGLYDKCLLVLVGDHGVSFRPGENSRSFAQSNAADIMSIPLFIKAPQQRQGAVSDRNVEIIDVLPTMADLLGIQLPWSTDGTSATDPQATERPTKVLDTLQSGQQTFEGYFPQRAESLRLMLERFGNGQDPLALYRIGPHGEIVGRSLDELRIGPESSCQVQCGLSHALRQWRLNERFAPCVFRGKVSIQGEKLPVHLAVTVRGVVRAVTRTSTDPDSKYEWMAAIPEDSLREGDNQVEFFVMEDTDGQLLLRPAQLAPE